MALNSERKNKTSFAKVNKQGAGYNLNLGTLPNGKDIEMFTQMDNLRVNDRMLK